jgi:hypothetical protein
VSSASLDDDAQLVEGIRRRLDADVAGLDDATVSRLKQARQMALAVAARGHHPWWQPSRPVGDWLVPAGAFASVVATAVALTLMVSEPGNGVAREIDDLELLTAGEELELYENLEFYLWLPDREQTG